MAETIKDSNKIASYMVVFLVHPVQVGVGILGFQTIIAKSAGNDSWMAVLLAGIAVSFVLWLMYAILNQGNGSVITIHKEVFGKWLGGALSIVFIIYFLIQGIMVIRTYSEVVQVWMFPTMKTWVISLMFVSLAVYTILGGLRAVIGMCFFGFFIPFLGIFPVVFPLWGHGNYHNFFPILTHSLPDILNATKDMSLTMLGFEVILLAYPFIQKPRSSQKWAHASNFFTILLYEFVTLLSFAFFNQEQMSTLIWPSLSMLKIVHFPFLERFEYLAICLWFLTVIPVIIVTLWAASRGAKLLCGCKQKQALVVFAVVVFVSSLLFQDRQQIDVLNNVVSRAGLYMLLLYLPFLWVVQRIVMKVRRSA